VCTACGVQQNQDFNAALNTLLSGQGLASKSEFVFCDRRIERARLMRLSENRAR
jgi:transposase